MDSAACGRGVPARRRIGERGIDGVLTLERLRTDDGGGGGDGGGDH